MKNYLILLISLSAIPLQSAVVLSPELTSAGIDIGSGASTPPVFSSPYTEITNLPGVVATASAELGGTWVADGVIDSGSSITGDAADWTFGEASESAPDASGWIPDANKAGTGSGEWVMIDFTGTTAGSFDIVGVDFITLFDRRTEGTFRFFTTTDPNPDGSNIAQWTEVGSVTNDVANDQFRAGFTFSPVSGATGLRLQLDDQFLYDSTDEWGAIGELDVYSIPEPGAMALAFSLTSLAVVTLRRRRRG